MEGRFLTLRVNLAALMTCLAFAAPHGAVAESAEDQKPVIRLVAEASADTARMIAVGIGTLANLRVEMADIDVSWVIAPDRSIASSLDAASDMALLDLGQSDVDGLKGDFEAVMTFWPSSSDAEDAAASNSGYLLVARPSVSSNFVQALLEAIEDDVIILKTAKVNIDMLDPTIAMASMSLSAHQGVGDYLAAKGGAFSTILAAASPPEAATPSDISPDDADEPAQTPIPETAPIARAETDGQSFTLYFDSDEAKLDRDDFKSVAAACKYAATLSTARFVISGHTDTVGPEHYNNELAQRRAITVANAIKNDPRFREALSVVEYGELMLAVATDDEVSEPMNRRVEITILEGD